MKRVLIAIFAVLIICLAGMLIAPSFIDWNIYKDKAVSEIKLRAGLDLNINGDLDFSLLPAPRFMISNVSVAAPAGSKSSDLLSFDRLEVSIALAPLFQGQVSVNSITLVKPVITLEMLENGSLNVITAELQVLIDGNNSGDASNAQAPIDMPAVSLDKIRVQDGIFTYYDHKSKVSSSIQNINADLSAASLTGPFKAQGSLFYDGYALNFDASSGVYDSENNMLPLSLELSLKPNDIMVEYAGVMNLENGISLQGQTSLRIENIDDLLSGYNIDDIVAPNIGLQSKGLLSADAKNMDYKNFDILIGDEKLSGSLRVSFAPLKYNLTIKSTADIDLSKLIDASIPFNKGSIDLVLSGSAQGAILKKSTIILDRDTYKISGNYKPNSKSGRSEIDLDINIDELNYDKIAASSNGQSSANQDIENTIKSLALPFDLKLGLSVDKLIWQNNDILGVLLSSEFKEDSISVSKLSVKNLSGASVSMSGSINNLKTTANVKLYADVDAYNIKSFTKLLDIDASALPKDLKKARVKASASGSLDALDIKADITAINGEIIAKGRVKSPFKQPAINDIILQIKHRNMAEAVRILTGVKLNNKKFTHKLDLYTKITQSGQVHTLNDIKGNLSGISMQGNLTLDLGADIPDIKGDLIFGKINLNSVMTSNAAVSSSRNSRNKPSTKSRWSKSPLDISTLHAINANVNLQAQKIEYGAWPLVKPSMKLELNSGTLKITDLKAGLFGGNIAMSSYLTSKPNQPINFNSKMSVNNTDLGKLSKALIGTQLVKITGDGNFEMDISSAGSSPDALIRSLSGNGTVRGADIVLDGVDIVRFARALSGESKTGDSVLGIWKGATKGGRSEFDTLDGAFDIKGGVVNMAKMDLDGAAAAIATRGNINLPNWTLDTKHKITVKGEGNIPSDVPPFEVSFNGSLDNPAQTLGQGLLNDYFNRKIQRKLNKLLSDKIGLPSNDNKLQPKQQDTPAATPSKNIDIEDVAGEAIKGILEGLLR